MMDLLITGATGFLGRETVRQAVESGLRVRATGLEDYRFAGPVEFRQADVLEAGAIRELAVGVSTVIHAAGMIQTSDGSSLDLNLLRRVNETGTENVARAAADAGAGRLVLISSVSVYGGGPAGGADEARECHPEGAYPESKMRAESIARAIAERAGMHLIILRLATLYGEGDRGNVIRLMRQIDRDRFFWIGKGLNRKSLLHRDDAARAVLLGMRAPAGIYNVSASAYPMEEIVRELAFQLGRRLPRWHIPGSLALRVAALTALPGQGGRRSARLYGSLKKWLSDDVYPGTRFEQATGFRAQVELKEGLRREVAWYRSQSAAGLSGKTRT